MAKKTLAKKPTKRTVQEQSAAIKAETAQYLLTQKELDQIDDFYHALKGLIELADPHEAGERRSISVYGLAALLQPVSDGLVDIFCAVMDRDVKRGNV